MPYIHETVIAGKTIEISKYYSHRYKCKNAIRSKSIENTKEAQERKNYKRQEKKLTRLINTNFKENDYHVVLNYKKEERPATIEDMKNDMRQFLKSLRGVCKKNDIDLKYIYVAERGKKGALHFHMVINKIDPGILTSIWKKGRVNIHMLDNTGQYKDLAAYLLKFTKEHKQEAKKLSGKAWSSSRNLKKPLIIKKIINKHDFFKEKVSIPKKYRNEYYLQKDSIYNGFHYETGYKFFTYTLIKSKN